MYKIVIEQSEERYGEHTTKEYEFYNLEIAIGEYTAWCLLLKSYEYQSGIDLFADAFFIQDENTIDHRYFIGGRYA